MFLQVRYHKIKDNFTFMLLKALVLKSNSFSLIRSAAVILVSGWGGGGVWVW